MAKVSTFIGIIILTSVWQTLTCLGCDVGYWGEACDKQCPVNCVTCTQDSIDRGRPCTSCVSGKYNGRRWDISGLPYDDDCSSDCSNRCVSCASFDNCTECVNGRYGTDCQYGCYSGCEGGLCDKIDGKCTCKIGDASRFCKSKPSCTNTRCKSNICETNNDNYCTHGCTNGRWGITCDNICLVNCDTCTQDSRDSGHPCTSCVPGKYSGRYRDKNKNPYYDDCRHDCRIKCVSCASYDNCTECVDGRYGTYCQYYCYSGCEGALCDKMDGKCYSCIDGYWGQTCDKQCPVNCVTCTQDSVDSGRPCTACLPGTYSGFFFFDMDEVSRYKDDCRYRCDSKCVSCSSRNNCTKCVDGRYGTICQHLCDSGCEGGQCDKKDGQCICKIGYASRFCKGQASCTNNPCICCKNKKCDINNGNYCTDGCIDGIWGDTCTKRCPINCVTCTRATNKIWACTSCVPGQYIGNLRDNSFEQYYDDCYPDCRDECVACISYNNCSKCVNGRYGPICQYPCYSGCDGGQCDKMDGKCTCKTVYASRFCNDQPSCTSYPCACCKNNTCETNNSTLCTEDCIDGIWGGACVDECSVNCETCTQGSKDYGRPCTSCVLGKYIGRKFEIGSSGQYFDDCRLDCRSNCVSCTSWFNCTECVKGQFGTDCHNVCSIGCEGGICNKTDGSCLCVNGRYGKQCENSCGNGCNDGSCDQTNGSCSCKTGFSGDKCCVNNNNCENCSSNKQCSVCKSGYSGDKCCVNNERCLTCVSPSACSNCKPGYNINTNCNECLLNKYGPNCISDCNSNCLNKGNQSKCYGHNGTCVDGCQEGFYGDKCDWPCHKNCKQIACSRVNGICSYGCQDGFNIFESYCVPAMPNNDDGDFPVAILGGAIGGGVAVVLIIVGIVVFLIKRRNHRPQCCSATTHDETQEMQLVAVNAGDNETSEVCINGTISYHPQKVLGHGAHGIVYQGRYGRCEKRTVAVKIIKCSNDDIARDTHTELQNIYKEIKAMEILAEDTHIIQFFDSYINNTTVYLVFKLAMGTLVDLVKNDPWRKSLTSDDVIRGLVNGLNHVHTMNIVHRDIKPGNIFIIDHGVSGLKAVIGDFGQAKPTTGNMFTFTGNFGSNAYTAPEIWTAMSATATTLVGTQFNKASDVFSLGLVAYYAISLGKHPFGNEMNAQVSISRGDAPTFNDIANLINSFAYEDMLKGMLKNNPDDRPSIQAVTEHPALFTSDKVIKYFGLKSDEFESKIRAGTSNTNLLEDPNLIPNGNWMNRLPVNLRTYLRSYKLPNRPSPLYKGHEKEVRFLLRAVRNTNGHFQAYPKNAQSEMGIFPEGHVDLWLTVCPGLLMHVYNKI